MEELRFMEITFKIAGREDILEIIELCNESFNETTSLDYAYRIFDQTKEDSNQIYIIGIMDGKIIAHLKITIIPTMYEKMNTYAILNHVCVKQEYRRHNIATKMLDYATEICKEKNCVCMELWSNNFREAAHACYKNYGFIINDAKFFSKEI